MSQTPEQKKNTDDYADWFFGNGKYAIDPKKEDGKDV
jgi:hypothetical protein